VFVGRQREREREKRAEVLAIGAQYQVSRVPLCAFFLNYMIACEA